jgi:hypothetical protein
MTALLVRTFGNFILVCGTKQVTQIKILKNFVLLHHTDYVLKEESRASYRKTSIDSLINKCH